MGYFLRRLKKKKKIDLKGLEIVEGKITNISGIESQEEEWVFTNNDPQIYIRFQQPVWGLRYTRDLEWGELIGREFSKIYFKTNEEDFSERKCCDIPFTAEKKIVREIHFVSPIDEIRFDPAEASGRCKIRNISFVPLYEKRTIETVMENEIPDRVFEKGVLLFTHAMSLSGAPILAYHIAVGLQEKGISVIVLAREMGDGFLEDWYKQHDIPVIPLNVLDEGEFAYIDFDSEYSWRIINRKNYTDVLFHLLKNMGYTTAITNSIVSGEYVAGLKQCDFKVVSLIHEMKTTIELYNFVSMGRQVAEGTDYIVFPNEVVKNDFLTVYPDVKGKCLIRAQGLYLNDSVKIKNSSVLSLCNIGDNDTVIMSSGTCELRKGTDLFVEVAIMFLMSHTDNRTHFVWTGEFYSPELKGWIFNQIERSGYKDYIHFIPFVKDPGEYKALLRRANIFLAMSREDPFPSTVLEAMQNGVPVIGFKNTGGIQIMLDEGRGMLKEAYDLKGITEGMDDLLMNNEMRSEICRNAKIYLNELNFDSYVDFLEKII